MNDEAKSSYQDELITFYQGDCRKVKEWLDCDVLITDPPYGRNWKQGALRKDKADIHHGIRGDQDTSLRDEVLALWGKDRPAACFGDLMLAPPEGTRQVLVYQKSFDAGRRGTFGGFRRDLEAIYLLGRWPAGISTGRGSLLVTRNDMMISGANGRSRKWGHPHAKPLDVLTTLIESTGKPGASVADPFAGSGTTLIAARYLGLRATGVEIDERFAGQCLSHLSQGDLFSNVS